MSADGVNFGRTGNAAITNDTHATLYMSAINDEAIDGVSSCLITHTAQVDDPVFNDSRLVFSVSIQDNDGSVGIRLDSQSQNQSVDETSIIDDPSNWYSYTLSLDDAPQSEIAITATTDDQCTFLQLQSDGTLIESSAPQNILFPADTTDVVHTLYVGAVADSIVESNHLCRINHSMTTDDPFFSLVPVDDQYIGIIDDDEFLQIADSADPVVLDSSSLLEEGDVDNNEENDVLQPNVTGIQNIVVSRLHGFIVESVDGEPQGCTLITNISNTLEEIIGSDANYTYPLGIYSVSLDCDAPAQSARVTLLLDKRYDDVFFWQLRQQVDGVFSDVEDYDIGIYDAQFGEVSAVSFTLQDGANGDDDGQEDGRILANIGLGQIANKDLTPTDIPIVSSSTALASPTAKIVAVAAAPVAVMGIVLLMVVTRNQSRQEVPKLVKSKRRKTTKRK